MEALVREIDATGTPTREVSPGALKENVFYHFDAEAMAAVGHAIEDLALEEANGSLFAACQDFRHFDANRERYEQLGGTIAGVQVLAGGKAPRRMRGVKLIKDARGVGRDFWAVLFQGKPVSALLLCRQAGGARVFEEKKFTGFFTFDARVIARVRADLDALASGRGSAMREFARLAAIDQVAREIEGEFLRERAAVNAAFRRLQLDGERYRPVHLATDLEEGLARLNQCKNRMCAILDRAEAG